MPTPTPPETTLPPELVDLAKTVLLGGAGLVVAYLKKLIDEYKAGLLKKRQSDPLYLADKQLRLDQFTSRAVIEADADHTCVFKFHNGEHYAGGDSILKMTMASEDVSSPSFARHKEDSKNINTNGHPTLMNGVGKQAMFWLHAGRCEDYDTNQMLARRGHASSVVLLARGKGGQWLGLLMLSWHKLQDESTVSAADLVALQTELGFLMNP
ncbi:hypothetical protein [Hymenobacter sp. YC55]|uniref:hypothetical protein n=1 Tax=Hymenobacter sp. YC55 TaxID=3034019 RepID=UPI0023F62592|nr:hypothetical protein [Hymenobacter sp. YC55]MDF7810687.1 hypothetical protein [Hymenobacter sp. YC55]